MLATTYPLLDAFFTILWFFLFVLWIWVLIAVTMDLFRSEMSGPAKAGWFVLVLFLPLFGVLIYLLARGSSMATRAAQERGEEEQTFRSYVRDVAGDSSNPADQLVKLNELRERGAISDEEYADLKGRLITKQQQPPEERAA